MFLKTDRPRFLPYTTLLGSAGGPVVDTGIDMLVGGRVYVDETEASEIARHFGFLAPKDADRLRSELARVKSELAVAKAKLRRVSGEVDSIVKA